jgi:hypothetical protein
MLRKANMSHFGSAITSLTAAREKRGLFVAALIAVALAGCAQQQGHQEAQAAVPPPQPQPAYCEPSPAPNCAFKGSQLKTVDAAEFARLKTAYERRCIRHAEKAERERMRELQAAGACEGRPAPSLAASR